MKAGITGHQKLGTEDTIAWLLHTIERIIIQYNIQQGFTSLAVGADQLFTEVLKKIKLPYVAIIPCNKYAETFQNQMHTEKYYVLLQSASDIITLEYETPSEKAFFEAGKLVVNLSDIVIAIWNGKPAQGLGGTGDIVAYALSLGKRIIHVDPIKKTVEQI